LAIGERIEQSIAVLARALTPVNATAMVVGTIIGASIFVQPSEIARHVGTPAEILLVWLVCGILTLFGALVCAELASAFPHTGGVYVFLRDTFSPFLGFLWGWAMFWSMHAGIIAAVAVIFARYTAYFVPVGDAGTRLIAVAVILALSGLNYVGVRAGSLVQTAFTIAKLVAIVGIILAGLAWSGAPPVIPAAGAVGSFDGLVPAMVAGLFAYGGWHMVTYAAGETKAAARTIPRALVVGVAIVTAAYMGVNLVYLSVLPVDAVRTSTRIAADAADALMGRGGSAVMAALVMISTFGALTGIVLAGPRVYYSMAQDGLAFRSLGRVHPVFHTPSTAIVAQAIWSSALAATGVYRELFTRVIYTEWLFFGIMAAGLFVLRRRADYQPSYRTWGYPVVPLVFIGSSFAIVIHQIASDPIEAATGLGLVLVGAPIYYLWVRT